MRSVFQRMFGKSNESSVFHYLRDKSMTVHFCTFDRHEQIARLYFTAVNCYSLNLLFEKRDISMECAMTGFGNILYCHMFHKSFLFLNGILHPEIFQ